MTSRSTTGAVRSAERSQQPVLGGEQLLGGEDHRVPRPEDGGAVLSAEDLGADRQLGRRQRERLPLGGVDDHADDRFAVLDAGEAPPHRLPGRLGPQVPVPPRRALLADRSDHRDADLGDHVERDVVGPEGWDGRPDGR